MEFNYLVDIYEKHKLWLNENYEEYLSLDKMFIRYNWWTEIAGLWLLGPRQSGKTTSLYNLAKTLGNNTVTIFPNIKMKTVAEDNFIAWPGKLLTSFRGTSWLYGIDSQKEHLLLDEFMFIDEESKYNLLSLPWLSVTGIGTMK